MGPRYSLFCSFDDERSIFWYPLTSSFKQRHYDVAKQSHNKIAMVIVEQPSGDVMGVRQSHSFTFTVEDGLMTNKDTSAGKTEVVDDVDTVTSIVDVIIRGDDSLKSECKGSCDMLIRELNHSAAAVGSINDDKNQINKIGSTGANQSADHVTSRLHGTRTTNWSCLGEAVLNRSYTTPNVSIRPVVMTTMMYCDRNG